MISCVVDPTEVCQASSVSTFNSLENVCVAWTEVGRGSTDSISIYIYDKNKNMVFSYSESTPPTAEEYRICRSIPIRLFTVPNELEFSTEFVIANRPFISGSPILWVVTK
jgi:hypothetical protein